VPGNAEIALRLAIAALAGLAVGVEREWSGRLPDATTRFAGIRTFLLLGLAGGLAFLVGELSLAAGGVLLAGAAALVVVAYVSHASRRIDGTTEVAALVVLAAGLLAGSGRLALASGIAATTALVLAEKGPLHAAVERIRSDELEAGARFAVLALVVLPLLPAGPYGPPPGIHPRELWALVLLFSGLGFAGYIAVRVAGPERGYTLAGLLGGIVSSTAVSLSFARESREQPERGAALARGVTAACTMLNARVVAVALVLAPALGLAAARILAPATLAGVLLSILPARDRAHRDNPEAPANPLRLRTSLLMAVGFQIAIMLLAWARARFGSLGVYGSATVLGVVDMDALTFSMVQLAHDAGLASAAARALAVGVAANSVLKLVIVLALGGKSFRRPAAIGMGVLAATTLLGLVLARG